jgi:hypothetical protein
MMHSPFARLAAWVAGLACVALPAVSPLRGDDTPQPPASGQPCDEEISPELLKGLPRDRDITDNPKPVAKIDSWLKWGGDLRYRMYIEENIKLKGDDPQTRRRFWHRPRVRIWGKATPHKDLSVFTRLTYEPRYFCEPDFKDQLIFNEAIIDQLYVEARNVFGLPLKVRVGRQDITLGDGWLVREGTPLDGGRTFFFDAARLTWDDEASKSTLDVIYLQQYADSARWIRPINDAHRELVDQNEKGAIVYYGNNRFEKTRLQGYFIYKHADKQSPKGYNADLFTFGGLAAGELGPHWRYKVEVAAQFGNKNGESVSALGSDNRIAYCFGDAWKTKAHFDYEYRSGAHNPNEQFDILWGRYTQFSNLYNYYISTLEGQMAMSSNLHRFGPGISIEPTDKLYLGASYHLLFRDRPADNFDSHGPFRGHLVTAKAEYKFTKDISLRVLYDVFVPGDFYHPLDNTGSFIQTQLAVRW